MSPTQARCDDPSARELPSSSSESKPSNLQPHISSSSSSQAVVPTYVPFRVLSDPATYWNLLSFEVREKVCTELRLKLATQNLFTVTLPNSTEIIKLRHTPQSRLPGAPCCIWEREGFAFEIRENIMDHLVEDDPNLFRVHGKVPDIVKALRPLPVTYDQVLQWLERKGVLCLGVDSTKEDSDTIYYISDMDISPLELSKIREVSIQIVSESEVTNLRKSQFYTNGRKLLAWCKPLNTKPTRFTEKFRSLDNIRTVSIYMTSRDFLTSGTSFVTEFPLYMQGFKCLTNVNVFIATSALVRFDDRINTLMEYVLGRVDRMTGVAHVAWTMVNGGIHEGVLPLNDLHTNAYLFCWVAPEGQSMDWTKEMGKHWIDQRNFHSYTQYDESEYGELDGAVSSFDKDFWDPCLDAELGFEDGHFVLQGWSSVPAEGATRIELVFC